MNNINNRVVIKESKIGGLGVFANANFRKGEAVLDIDDSHIVQDVNMLIDSQKDHCDWLNDNKVVLMQEPEKYINHSCEPNTYVKTIDGIRRVIAMRDTKTGEEITYDYAINGYYDSEEVCRCGSKNCRGTISPNFFRLPKEKQLEYRPYLDEWFTKQFADKLREIST